MSYRQRYNVGVVKIPHADRDITREVIGDTGESRDFFDIIGADTPDDHDDFPVGSHCTYAVDLDEHEAQRFADASNCRWITPDDYIEPITEPENDATTTSFGAASSIPSARTLAWMRAAFNGDQNWHGRDVPIAILDQGTTAAVRRVMGWTLLGRGAFGTPPAGEVHNAESTHGCLVAPNGVPAGGRILDAVITEPSGGAARSSTAAATRWAANLGAKYINLSFAGPDPDPIFDDLFTYLATFDCQFFAAAGNSGEPAPRYPAAYSSIYPHVHSVIAFDDATDQPASFTNYGRECSGCAPGVQVNSLTLNGTLRTWNGTSAASPHAVLLHARLSTGGQLTTRQVVELMRENLRETGNGVFQGQGAYQLLPAVAARISRYGGVAGAAGRSLVSIL